MNIGLIEAPFLALCAGFLGSLAQEASIDAGTRISNNCDVPTYLTDGTAYLPFTVNVPPGANGFLLPVDITGAEGSQISDFASKYNTTVVQEVDNGDGTPETNRAEFAQL